MSPVVRLLVAVGVVLFSITLVVGLGSVYSRTPGMATGITLAILFGIFLFMPRVGLMLAYIFVGSLAAVASSVFLEYPLLAAEPALSSVKEAPGRSWDTRFAFSDALVHRRVSAIAVQRGRRSVVGSWEAAVVAPADWNTNVPVPAIAAWDREGPRDQGPNCSQGVRFVEDQLSPAHEAVASLRRKHRLQVARGAPVLDCRPGAPERHRAMQRKIGILLGLSCVTVGVMALAMRRT